MRLGLRRSCGVLPRAGNADTRFPENSGKPKTLSASIYGAQGRRQNRRQQVAVGPADRQEAEAGHCPVQAQHCPEEAAPTENPSEALTDSKTLAALIYGG